MTSRKRGKAQKAWIAILAFCLIFFIALDIGMAWFEVIYLRTPWREMVRPMLAFCIVTWIAYQALRKRLDE